MTNALAKKTIRRINDAIDVGQTGAMSEIVQTVRRLSGEIAHVSVTELSEIISQDPTVTEKIVSAANTFGYNPTGAEIETVSEAIHAVGFERVRSLTLSLTLAQGAGNSMDGAALREMADLSVCSGMLAQTLIAESEHMRADPELAFVGGSLRNYGKLLMSTFFVEEYLIAKEQARKSSNDGAFEEVFGITPLLLGQTLLRSTNLPEIIMASLKRVPREKLELSVETETDEILIAAEFCVSVCELAFDESLTPDSFEKGIFDINQEFGESLPIKFETVVQALETVNEQMGQLNLAIGIKDGNSPANQKLRSRVRGEPLKRTRPPKHAKKISEVIPMGIEKVESEPGETLEGILSSRGERMLSEEGIYLSKVYAALNSAITRELNLDGCIAFLKDKEESRGIRYSARHGIGPLYERVKNKPLLAPDKRDIFGICLSRKEDILIQDTKTGKISSVIPEWIHDRGEVASIIMLPAFVEKDLFALFVGTKTDGSVIEMGQSSHRRLKQLRLNLATLQKKR